MIPFPSPQSPPTSVWAPHISTTLGLTFAFSARGIWAGTKPVSPSSLPEMNELESIDEDSPRAPAQAAPVAARSSSSLLEPTATMSVLSLSILSRFATSSAAPSSYRHASIEKPVVQSAEPVTSSSSLVSLQLRSPSSSLQSPSRLLNPSSFPPHQLVVSARAMS